MAEKRLIYADTLLETIHDTADGLADCDQQNAAWALRKYAARDIMDAPTVDAVEVVRCKDCICSHPDLVFHKYKSFNTWCAKLNRDMKLTGFCSYGERRTDG